MKPGSASNIRRFAALISLSVVGLLQGVAGAAWVPVVVTGDRVCLRSRPDGRSEVVHQVSTGDALQANLGSTGQWAEVIAPPSAEVWISTELVSNGFVTVDRGIVRAGPSRNYPSIGTVAQGHCPVVRRNQHGWLQIAPPDGCRLWISREYVRPVVARSIASPAKAVSSSAEVVRQDGPLPSPVHAVTTVGAPPAKPAAVAASPSPAVPVGDAVSTVAKAAGEHSLPLPAAVLPMGPTALRQDAARGLDSAPGAGQGRDAVYRGVLERCRWFWRPAPYRLIVDHPRRGRLVLCYVTDVPIGIDRMEGKQVEVSGREFRVRRQDRPLVAAVSIREREAD